MTRYFLRSIAWCLGFWLAVAPGLAGGRAGAAGPAGTESTAPAAVRRIALEIPAGAPARSGFTRLSAVDSGIRFTNRLDDRLVIQNNNYSLGSGVALGDFDGDGRCDLYFCAIDGSNVLQRNRGGWKFEDVTAKAGVACAGWHSTGAVFADLDGDGRLDLLVSTLGQGVHSFRNLGDGRFEETTAAAGLTARTGSLGMALGDVDGDGDLDLYVANYGAQAILRGGGRADVKRVNGEWLVSGPHADRLRMVNDRLEELGEPDVLYRNDGRGHFAPVPWNSEWFVGVDGKPFAAPWDFGLGVQMRDANGDGFPDLYVCNDFQTVDRFWLNDGTGHFRLIPTLSMRHQSFSSMGVDFADLDRDGRLDFMVADMLSHTPARRLRQLSGLPAQYPVPGLFENRPDAVRNTLFWNRGDGTYAEVACFAGVEGTDWTWQPLFLDVDLDGYEDLLTVNGTAFDVQDRDAQQQILGLGRQSPEDFRANLMRYPRARTANLAFRNRGDLTFEETGKAWGFDASDISIAIALADLDQDGDQDVVVNTLYGEPLLCRNDATAPRLAVRLRGRPPNVQGIGARLRLTGGNLPPQTQEIVSGGRYLAGDEPSRVFAAGSLTNRFQLEVTWRDGRRTVVTDVEPNVLCEIDEPPAEPTNGQTAVPTSTGSSSTTSTSAPASASAPWFTDVSARVNHRHREIMFDDYSRQPLLLRQLSSLGPGVGWIDLDGDGHDDLVVGAGRDGQVAVYRGDGRGAFRSVVPTNAPGVPDDLTGIAALTLRDGFRLALAGISGYEVASGKSAVVALELAPEAAEVGGTLARGMGVPDTMAGPIAVADYAGTGELGVFVGGRCVPGAYPRPAVSRLYRQGEDRRWGVDAANQAVLADAGLVSGATWSDLDGDGFAELVLATEWGPIRIYRNRHGRLEVWDPPVHASGAEPTKLGDWQGWWNSVAAGDVDGDGRLDLVVGNWGLNSPYAASPGQPLRFFHGDLGNRGVVDLIETQFDPDLRAALPRRSWSALSQAIPRIAAVYPTHAAFSSVPVEAMFRQLELSPIEVRASVLASGILLNRGEHFDWAPLPREAQFAPAYGIAVGDFDNDGAQDVFLAQNFFALRPEVPRLDGGRGLLLHNRGDGRLVPLPGPTSGIAVDGEQRGAAVSDFDEDGRLDLVVTQNGAATKVYRNALTRPGLRVRLAGPPGNPWGMGAAIQLRFEDGRTSPVQEVHGGGGYWSQDGVVAVFGTPAAARRVTVRWPGGGRTEASLPDGSREILVGVDGGLKVVR